MFLGDFMLRHDGAIHEGSERTWNTLTTSPQMVGHNETLQDSLAWLARYGLGEKEKPGLMGCSQTNNTSTPPRSFTAEHW